jgi:sugar phosphate isomerase/epimerase
MVPSLSPVTIGGAPEKLRDYIALAEQCGFGGVEVDMGSVIRAAEESSWDAVKALFEQLAVAPACTGLPVNWRADEATFEEGMAALPVTAKAAREIGCRRVCTWLPPSVNDDPNEFRRNTVDRFRKIAELLGDYGIRFGLEFVGPKTSRIGPKAMGANEFIYNLPQTLDLIRDIDARAANIGLLVDSFHWFCTGSSLDELAALSPKQIVHVHINDAPDVAVDDQLDMQRLLPGEGIIDLRGFLRTLSKAGYRDFVAVETFNKDLTALGREPAAEKAGAAMERIFSGGSGM